MAESPVVMAKTLRAILASTTPSQPTETTMWAVSSSLYSAGDNRRSPCLLRENMAILPCHDAALVPLAERQRDARGDAPDEGEQPAEQDKEVGRVPGQRGQGE